MEPLAIFKDFLRKKGLKITGSRLAVARTIFDTRDEHLSADDLLARLRRQGLAASKATVYRTLTLLTESGLLESWDFGAGRRSYDPVVSRGEHDHLVCRACGKVIEFKLDALQDLLRPVAALEGFSMRGHKLQVFGLCRDCGKGSKSP